MWRALYVGLGTSASYIARSKSIDTQLAKIYTLQQKYTRRDHRRELNIENNQRQERRGSGAVSVAAIARSAPLPASSGPTTPLR